LLKSGRLLLKPKLYLTFDVEDFINDRSIEAIDYILRLLNKHHQKAIFFVTGHMAEKLQDFPIIIQMLRKHEIGYHSTSHSVHPTIFEYTDIKDYQRAYQISLDREVAHINPLSGAIEGRGGIEAVRNIFSGKKIESFRAPGFSWSPPHLEALKQLGIKYDFSTAIADRPVKYKEITFFPLPLFIDSILIRSLFYEITQREVIIIDFHPNYMVNKDWWDSTFFAGSNPSRLVGVTPRSMDCVKRKFLRLNWLLEFLDILNKSKIIKPFGEVVHSKLECEPAKIDLEKVYRILAKWPKEQFNYEPRSLHSHLLHFFERSNSW
jgi:peptidoglycan/xylan/chitin deacetylase (PgdA/CDA1 family)